MHAWYWMSTTEIPPISPLLSFPNWSNLVTHTLIVWERDGLVHGGEASEHAAGPRDRHGEWSKQRVIFWPRPRCLCCMLHIMSSSASLLLLLSLWCVCGECAGPRDLPWGMVIAASCSLTPVLCRMLLIMSSSAALLLYLSVTSFFYFFFFFFISVMCLSVSSVLGNVIAAWCLLIYIYMSLVNLNDLFADTCFRCAQVILNWYRTGELLIPHNVPLQLLAGNASLWFTFSSLYFSHTLCVTIFFSFLHMPLALLAHNTYLCLSILYLSLFSLYKLVFSIVTLTVHTIDFYYLASQWISECLVLLSWLSSCSPHAHNTFAEELKYFSVPATLPIATAAYTPAFAPALASAPGPSSPAVTDQPLYDSQPRTLTRVSSLTGEPLRTGKPLCHNTPAYSLCYRLPIREHSCSL